MHCDYRSTAYSGFIVQFRNNLIERLCNKVVGSKTGGASCNTTTVYRMICRRYNWRCAMNRPNTAEKYIVFVDG
jgi:hypothetical protein